jgi:hypothetical protein
MMTQKAMVVNIHSSRIACHSCLNYEGKSISKLQILIEKKLRGIVAYKQHLCFNVISIQMVNSNTQVVWWQNDAQKVP